MKNKEKYPKTEDALKEYNLQLGLVKIVGGSASLSFDEWLEKDTFEDFLINTFKNAVKRAESVNLFDAIRKLKTDIRVRILKREEKTPEKKEAPKHIPCPLCGSTETEIEGIITPQLNCRRCYAVVAYKDANGLIDFSITDEELARRIIKSNLRR